MSTMRIEVDPDGDTLVTLAIKQQNPPPSASTDSSEAAADKIVEKHFLCSKKHLTLASRRAARLFASNFKEASKEEDGLYHWNFGNVFDAEAFKIVLNVIHGKTRAVPQTVSSALLAEIASIVDDLECADAILFFGHMWLMSFGFFYTFPKSMDKTIAQLILISFVFEGAKLFRTCTEIAIRHSSDIVPTFDLPIRADIISRIEDTRTRIFQDLFDGLYKLQNDLLEEKVGCNQGCRAMLLGALLQAMKASKLYPPPEPPFSSFTLDTVIESLRNVQSPRHFTSESPTGKHSGVWRLSERPSAPPAPEPTPLPRQIQSLFGSGFGAPAPTPVSGSLFGTPTVAQSTAASSTATGGLFSRSAGPQSTPTPRAASGGLFGASTTPQGTPTASTTPSGLFGNATAPQRTSAFGAAPASSSSGGLFGGTSAAAPANSQTNDKDAPQQLVRHDCCLKDFVDPLILAAEAKIQGLQLVDFPHL